MVLVIFLRGSDNLECFIPAINAVDPNFDIFSRNHFIRRKIMLKTLGFDRGQVFNIVNFSPNIVAFEHCDNFIVSFALINHLDTTDNPRIE